MSSIHKRSVKRHMQNLHTNEELGDIIEVNDEVQQQPINQANQFNDTLEDWLFKMMILVLAFVTYVVFDVLNTISHSVKYM